MKNPSDVSVRAGEVARFFESELNVRTRVAEWEPYRFVRKAADWPQLVLDDVTGIPFIKDIKGVELYQLRANNFILKSWSKFS